MGRVEDAGINASAPPQQRWLDGWLVRFSPGKAKRARCINALAPGRLPIERRLELARQVYDEAGLPALVRITRFSQPASLGDHLASLGWSVLDDTRVMVCPQIGAGPAVPLPPGMRWVTLDSAGFAETVGALRGSPLQQRRAQAQRLSFSPVPYHGHAIEDVDGRVLACGQFAREAELVGLYDVITRNDHRGLGLATRLCRHLLRLAAHDGAAVGYLQVEADNEPARRIYGRLGFADAYAYHYRQAP